MSKSVENTTLGVGTGVCVVVVEVEVVDPEVVVVDVVEPEVVVVEPDVVEAEVVSVEPEVVVDVGVESVVTVFQLPRALILHVTPAGQAEP